MDINLFLFVFNKIYKFEIFEYYLKKFITN